MPVSERSDTKVLSVFNLDISRPSLSVPEQRKWLSHCDCNKSIQKLHLVLPSMTIGKANLCAVYHGDGHSGTTHTGRQFMKCKRLR
jgi:hypothetical protein